MKPRFLSFIIISALTKSLVKYANLIPFNCFLFNSNLLPVKSQYATHITSEWETWVIPSHNCGLMLISIILKILSLGSYLNSVPHIPWNFIPLKNSILNFLISSFSTVSAKLKDPKYGGYWRIFSPQKKLLERNPC